MTARPASLRIGRVIARPVRGPEGERWYWRCDIRRAGRLHTAWTGWSTTTEIARRACDLDANEPDEAPRVVLDARPRTMSDLLEVWAQRQAVRRDLAVSTRAFYARAVGHLRGQLTGVPVGVPDASRLEAYRDDRLAEGAATLTVKQELAVLSRAWAWARQSGLVPDRSLPRVQLRVRTRRSRRTPVEADVEAALAHLHGWAKLAVGLLTATGARVGEIATLTRTDIDARRGLVRLDGKTGERWVPVPTALAARLVWSPDERVFGVAPETVRCSLGRMLDVACDAAGVERFTPHALRRLALDRFYASGADVGTVAALLGQSPEVALRHYRQSTEADRRTAVDRAGLAQVALRALI